MNKSALALAVFGFAAGIVLVIVVEPLLTQPTATPAPQLSAIISQPSAPSPPPIPPRIEAQRDDPIIQAAKVAVAKTLKDPPSAVFSDLSRAMRPNVRGEPMDTVCGSVNAKNSFGGYNGARGFVYFVGDGTANIAEGDQYAVGPMVVRNFCKNG